MHLYVRFYELNKENIQETPVNYRCQKHFSAEGEAVARSQGQVKLSISLHFHSTSNVFELLRHTRAETHAFQSEIRPISGIFQQNLLLNSVSYVPWEQKNMILNLEQ